MPAPRPGRLSASGASGHDEPNSDGRLTLTDSHAGRPCLVGAEVAGLGFAVVLGARRDDRLAALAADIGPAARTFHLDVTDLASVEAFSQAIPSVGCSGANLRHDRGHDEHHEPPT
jgi:hypothetical protein